MRGGLVGGSRVFHCTWPGGRLHGSNSPPQVPEYAERAGNRHKGDEDHIVLMAGAIWAYDVEIPRGILARAFSSSRSTKARRRMRSWRVDVQSATARGQTSRGAIPPPTATWISSSPLSSRYASKHLAGLPSGGHEGAAVARHCSLKETPSHPTAQLRPQ